MANPVSHLPVIFWIAVAALVIVFLIRGAGWIEKRTADRLVPKP